MTDVTVSASGVSGTSSTNSVTISLVQLIAATGFAATSGLGTPTLPGLVTTLAVTGTAGTSAAGTASALPSIPVPVTSPALTATLQTLPQGVVTGVAATGAIGNAVTQTQLPTTSPVTFTTVKGSTLVTVDHSDHGALDGDTVIISNVAFDADLYPDLAEQLEGEFVITKVNASQYTFNLSTGAIDGVLRSGEADVAYEINIGLDTATGGVGWGAGTWGRGAWGSAANVTASDAIRLWKQDNFGEDLIFNAVDDSIYYWDATLGLSTRGKPLTYYGSSAPTKARQVVVSDRDRHVIAFGANPINETDRDPLLIRFSSQENPFDWTPTATNTAGDLRIGNGSEIVQAIETRREIIVLTDSSVHSMQFIGPPFTFGITQLSNQTSIAGINSAVAVGDAVFWMGKNRFYVYDGRVQPLPCTVRDYVFDNFDVQQEDKIFAGSNAAFGEVFWFYTSDDNSTANGGTAENDRYVVYNYEQKIWYVGNLERTAWIDRGINEYPIATTSATNVDTPLVMYDHERGVDADGQAFTAYIESAPIDIQDGDNFVFVRRMIPDISFDKSETSATKEATFTLKSQRFPGTGFTTSKPLTVTDTTEQNHTRLRGRSFGLRVESDNQGVFWRLGSPRLDIRTDGRR
jgi:hypothetical protein